MPYEKDPNELGVLWEHTGNKGMYLKGVINDVKVLVYKNTRKTKDTQPDWRVMKSLTPAERPPAPPPEPEPPPPTDEDW